MKAIFEARVKILLLLTVVAAIIIPFLLVADTPEPSCGSPSDKDCDGRIDPNYFNYNQTGSEYTSLVEVDLHDGDASIGSLADEGFRGVGSSQYQ